MPKESFTIAAYAAGASLAAATLVYVFGPTFFLDDVDGTASRNDRKRMAVGLSNPANDCFINAILQALAGLPKLRLWLVRELYQRQQDGKEVYTNLDQTMQVDGQMSKQKLKPEWLRLGLQTGTLTVALKDMLNALNERPITRKTISASPFISAVEQALRTRVSRYQQDAQEFLQLILERLADEHNAGAAARRRAIERYSSTVACVTNDDDQVVVQDSHLMPSNLAPCAREDIEDPGSSNDDVTEARATDHQNAMPQAKSQSPEKDQSTQQDIKLPFEGQLESRIECDICHFKPKPSATKFVTLTLNVPHSTGSTTLDACLDGMMKVEQIDDFRCDRCRLEYARQLYTRQIKKRALNAQQRSALQENVDLITKAIEEDPETMPEGVELPDAPSSNITRFMRISLFPQILAIHLSRSVWDNYSSSSKNTAKVAITEYLTLGSLLDRRTYRLLGVVTHKGGHNSGHYESFRRQWLAAPPSTDAEHASMPTEFDVPITTGNASVDTGDGVINMVSQSPTLPDGPPSDMSSSLPSTTTSTKFGDSHSSSLRAASQIKLAEKKRKAQDRWWRISDDKIKECRLLDVLGMQKEVYILFYELT